MEAGLTQHVLGRAGHRVGVEGREDPSLPGAHVEAAEPEVILLGLHQHWVVHVQLQLVGVARDEPAGRGREVRGRGRRTVGCVHPCPITSVDG